MQALPLILGLLISAAGTGMSMADSQRAKSEQEAATQAELLRQQQRERNVAPVVQASRAASTPEAFTRGLDQARAEREQQFREGEQLSTGNFQSPIQTPSTIQTGNRLRQRAAASASAGNQAYMDVLVQQALRNADVARQMQVTGATAHDSAGVLPFELRQAGYPGALGLSGSAVSSLAPMALAFGGGGSGGQAPALGGQAPLIQPGA